MNYKNAGEIRKAVESAIVKLKEKGINGQVYFYKKDECSCCYGPKDIGFYVEGNYAGNQGIFGTDPETNGYGYRVVGFDEKNCVDIARELYLAVEEVGWTLSWMGSHHSCMFIKKLAK